MPRLPQPGADAGNWRQLLNGLYHRSMSQTAHLKTGSIDETVLASSVQTDLNTLAGHANQRARMEPLVLLTCRTRFER